MTQVNSITVHVQTADVSDAGSDGDVVLGICGREFVLDTAADDFERNSSRKYVVGAGSNVLHAPSNDPRKQNLHVEDADRLPVYLRFVQKGGGAWKLERATVTLNDRLFPLWDTAPMIPPREGIWLGNVCGLIVHIPKHQD